MAITERYIEDIKGNEFAQAIAFKLAQESCAFEFQPQSNNKYRFIVKNEDVDTNTATLSIIH